MPASSVSVFSHSTAAIPPPRMAISTTTNGARFRAEATGLPGVTILGADIFSRRFCRLAYARRDEAVDAGAAGSGAPAPVTAPVPEPPGALSPDGLSRVCSVVTMPPP